MRFPTKEFVAVVFGAFLISCGDQAVTSVIAPVATIAATASTTSLYVGATAQINATAYNADGLVMRGKTIAWTSSNTGVASVADQGSLGIVTGVEPGSATISASVDGKIATVSFTVISLSDCAAADFLSLNVGEVRTLNAQQKSLMCLGNLNTGSEYKLVLVNSSNSASNSATLTAINATAVAPASVSVRSVSTGMNGTEQFFKSASYNRTAVRLAEATFNERQRVQFRQSYERKGLAMPRQRVSKSALLAALPNEGDTVVMQTNFADASCAAIPEPRKARVVKVLRNVIVSVDLNAAPGGYTDAELSALAFGFDTLGFSLDTLNFGSVPDVDANNRVNVFFTPAIISIGADGAVFPRDRLPVAACPVSNAADVIYMGVPDLARAGYFGDKAAMLAFAPFVLVHELQHVINGAAHYPASETAANNEGLSYLSEELLFYKLSGLTPGSNLTNTFSSPAATAAFGPSSELLYLYFSFAERPEVSSPFGNVPDQYTIGAIWHLLRFSADRKGGNQFETWRALVNSGKTGTTNLVGVFGNLPSLMRDWAVSHVVDDVVPTVAASYQFPSWNYHAMTLNGGFPLKERDLVGAAARVDLIFGGSSYFRFGIEAGKVASVSASNNGVVTALDVMLVRTK